MAVDRWATQDGVIVKGLVCGFATAGSAIAEGDFVKLGTSANEQIVVVPATSAAGTIGDGTFYAMKAAGTGEKLPVFITGIVKVSCNETLAIGKIVITESATDVAGSPLVTASHVWTASGTQHIIGTLLQAVVTPGDEVLMLLGMLR